MLSKPLSDLVAYTVTTMSDRPVPTAMEVLTAMNRLAEEVSKMEYARGFTAGSRHTSLTIDKVLGSMGNAP